MALFSGLSEELVLAILSYLEGDVEALYNITLVSKYHYELGRLLLYRHVKLTLDARKYERFLRSIEANETLGPLVRKLCLILSSGTITPLAVESPNRLLSLLPHLQIFEFSVDDLLPFGSRPLQTRPQSLICRYALTIRQNCYLNELADFISQNPIHSLEVNGLSLHSLTNNPRWLLTSSLLQSAPLESLNLHSSIHLPCELLSALLKFPSVLKSLKCVIPKNSYSITRARTVRSHHNTPVEPSSVTSALSPVAHSLEVLEFIGNAEESAGHDGTRIDLSGIVKLKRLICESYLLFDSPEAGPKRDATYTLLPPALEGLTINFDLRNHLLTAPARHPHSRETAISDPSDHRWLAQIAANKPKRFPQLRRLSLLERVEDANGHEWAREAWRVPEDLRKAFDRAGIEFLTRMRVGTRVEPCFT